MSETIPVQITLKNRKVYIALILNSVQIKPHNGRKQFITISPLKSGYRDADTLDIKHLTVDYTFLTEIYLKNMSAIEEQRNIQITIGKEVETIDSVIFNYAMNTGMAIDVEEILSIAFWDGAIFKKFNQNDFISVSG